MKESTDSKTFYGMKVVSDSDIISTKGKHVIEVNSNNTLVCRYYTNNGLAEDSSMELDYIVSKDFTEANVTENLKHQIDLPGVLISESAISFIQDYVKAASTSN